MTLDYGNEGIFFIMGNAGFISSTVRVKGGLGYLEFGGWVL